ncbi:hypothetical protein BC938DRAFT_474167 [Jimgerdemannia flammicorona]|uniref:Uncharacterized protein n=1 Tax=Jimgerdemannia flammicorona TaxID=994334 RepID=A0A433QSP8_9FUNG|nr:hypothetical protein BC938DRAFT_474167 [Jimgerdemannia flammicorona]
MAGSHGSYIIAGKTIANEYWLRTSQPGVAQFRTDWRWKYEHDGNEALQKAEFKPCLGEFIDCTYRSDTAFQSAISPILHPPSQPLIHTTACSRPPRRLHRHLPRRSRQLQALGHGHSAHQGLVRRRGGVYQGVPQER